MQSGRPNNHTHSVHREMEKTSAGMPTTALSHRHTGPYRASHLRCGDVEPNTQSRAFAVIAGIQLLTENAITKAHARVRRKRLQRQRLPAA